MLNILIAALYAVVAALYVLSALDSGRVLHWSLAAIWCVGCVLWLGASYFDWKAKKYRERANKWLA